MSFFERNIPMKDHTTLQVGGPAELFSTVTSEAELIDVVKTAQEDSIPFRVIGGGSNILVPDSGLKGLTIRNMITGWKEQGTDGAIYVAIGAGEVFDRAVAYAVSKGYWGLENLSHIPGSVGATPVQNVGAYGVEIKDVIKELRALNTESMEIETLSAGDCLFGYRDSIFKTQQGKKYIITNVVVQLSTLANPMLEYKDLAAFFKKNTSPKIEEIRDAVIAIRAKKFPDWHKVGTAGSFFKNPIVRRVVYEKLRMDHPGLPGFDVSDNDVKIPLGWILDNVCGLRGVSEGNVGTYEGQALVIINRGNATAQELTDFAEKVAQQVYEKTGLKIEWEVTRLDQ